MMSASPKVLQIAASDVMVKNLLLPLIDRLISEGYETHVACSDGRYTAELRKQNYNIHTLSIKRSISPLAILRSLWGLYRLIKKERFDIVHVHGVASISGRLAAWGAGVPLVIYTAHGFYFHDNMSRWIRRSIIWVEKFLALFTDVIFTQSKEDAITSVKERICPPEKVVWIGNGVDTARFSDLSAKDETRSRFGLSSRDKVVGFVGRFVYEKGIIELLQAMQRVSKEIPYAKLLLVGDNLESDRDKKTRLKINKILVQDDLNSRVVLTGFIDDVADAISAMDVFVLPSHREGMPRSILEAMASGKPVVATNIRGCREEVINGLTGLIIPYNDVDALSGAIIEVLLHPEKGRRMGIASRQRANEVFDERTVLDRQIRVFSGVSEALRSSQCSLREMLEKKKVQLFIKRLMDVAISSVCLAILAIPFVLVGLFIKIDSRGPVFFHQERIGKVGKPFVIWKFRTMVDNAVNQGLGLNVCESDDRITRVGRTLRNWGLDELPQLINVLAGEMSIVGPRSGLPYQVDLYNDVQRQRLLVKPGITNLPLIKGRNLLTWKERIDLDIQYLSDWSLLVDFKIILKTFWVVLVTRKGVYGATGINDDFISNLPADSSIQPNRTIETKVGSLGRYQHD